MLRYLNSAGMTSERKCRLFVVACGREVLHLCPDRALVRIALATAEGFADGSETAIALIEAEGTLGPIGRQGNGVPDSLEEGDSANARFHAMMAVRQAVCLDDAAYRYRDRVRDAVWHATNASACE